MHALSPTHGDSAAVDKEGEAEDEDEDEDETDLVGFRMASSTLGVTPKSSFTISAPESNTEP